jgi:RTX calcium-binding nonapeptide repeat (4 copies)/WD40-like Beta Propeller Repeat
MKMTLRLLLMTLPALVPIGGAGAEPPPEADGPKIAYVQEFINCKEDCDSEIYFAHSDLSAPTPVTDNALHDYNPQWSPDGRHLLFERFNGTARDIWVMNADGSNEINLTQSPGIEEHRAQWSPDGAHILYVRGEDLNPEDDPAVWVMRAYGAYAYAYTFELASDATDPNWSPDGGFIAFRRQTEASPMVVMKPVGAAERNIANAADFDWSQNGRRLAFAERKLFPGGWGDAGVLRTIDPDGSNLRRLYRMGDKDDSSQVLWFPSGEKIGLTVEDPATGYAAFRIIRLDGTSAGIPSSDPREVALSPSGSWMAYIECGPGDCDGRMHVQRTVNQTGGGIAVGQGASEPDWQPVCTVVGTDESETLEGTSGNDLICGFGGDDEIGASGGDDVILGGSGNDTVWGDGGNDTIYGQLGGDTLRAGEGNDVVGDLSGYDTLLGGPGKDTLGARDPTSVAAGRLRDEVRAGAGDDVCRVDVGDIKEGCP